MNNNEFDNLIKSASEKLGSSPESKLLGSMK